MRDLTHYWPEGRERGGSICLEIVRHSTWAQVFARFDTNCTDHCGVKIAEGVPRRQGRLTYGCGHEEGILQGCYLAPNDRPAA